LKNIKNFGQRCIQKIGQRYNHWHYLFLFYYLSILLEVEINEKHVKNNKKVFKILKFELNVADWSMRLKNDEREENFA
jgi:hypothetical protein